MSEDNQQKKYEPVKVTGFLQHRHMTQIFDKLYLSDNTILLEEHSQVNVCISLLSDYEYDMLGFMQQGPYGAFVDNGKRPPCAKKGFYKFKLDDCQYGKIEDILSLIETCVEIIRKHIEMGDTVSVNCWQGASRSATIILCYLIKYQGMTAQNALQYVREIRPCVQPNMLFCQAIEEFEKMYI